MNHSDIQARMADYLDGDLSLDSRALFDAHLDQCDGCSRELMDMRDTIRLLRTLPNPEPPADLVSDVMQRIADGEGQPNWLGRFLDQMSKWVIPRIAIPVTAVAAALTLTVITGDLSLGDLDLRAAPRESGAVAKLRVAPDKKVPTLVALPAAASANRQPRASVPNRVQIAKGVPLLRFDRNSRSGQFLYRLAADQRGPIRRQPREGDVAYRMFHVGGAPALGPYPPASMPPSIYLGRGDVTSNPRLVRQNPSSGFDRGMTPVKVTRISAANSPAGEELSLQERRLRELDTRLGLLMEDPPGFAHGMARVSLAEQELWLRELAARAEESGDVERVMSALEGSGDAEALRLAREFDMAVKHNRASWAAAEASSSSN